MTCIHNGYEMLCMLGQGGFGTVCQAKRVVDGTLFAIKMIKMAPVDNDSLIQQEISIMQSCIHPNIVKYFESFVRPGEFNIWKELWIIMEYCGGGSLHHIYTNTRGLSELEIAFVCKETLKGLEYLHSRNIVHRDIKGANILVTSEGNIKLADFGLSAKISDSKKNRESIKGTLHWMAPEVFKVSKMGGYNQLCDIWSVGITAIELAECKPPLSNLLHWEFINHVVHEKPPALSDTKNWSLNFHHFVKVALTKNPTERPTAQHLLKDKFLKEDLASNALKDLLKEVKMKKLPSTAPRGSDASISSAQKNPTFMVSLEEDLFDSQNPFTTSISHTLTDDDSTGYDSNNDLDVYDSPGHDSIYDNLDVLDSPYLESIDNDADETYDSIDDHLDVYESVDDSLDVCDSPPYNSIDNHLDAYDSVYDHLDDDSIDNHLDAYDSVYDHLDDDSIDNHLDAYDLVYDHLDDNDSIDSYVDF